MAPIKNRNSGTKSHKKSNKHQRMSTTIFFKNCNEITKLQLLNIRNPYQIKATISSMLITLGQHSWFWTGSHQSQYSKGGVSHCWHILCYILCSRYFDKYRGMGWNKIQEKTIYDLLHKLVAVILLSDILYEQLEKECWSLFCENLDHSLYWPTEDLETYFVYKYVFCQWMKWMKFI